MRVSKNGSILNISLSMDESSFISDLEVALETAFSWQEENWMSQPNFFSGDKKAIGYSSLDGDDPTKEDD